MDTPPRLASFSPPLHCAVIGAGGGLGAALVAALLASERVASVHALSRTPPPAPHARLAWSPLELTDEDSIAAAAAATGGHGPLDLVIVASGRLHGASLQPEKRWEQLSAAALGELFAVNATGPALCAKHFLPLLRPDAKAVFAAVSARVGSIGDNRAGGWYAYRASKAALNMLLKTLALELARRRPRALCLGLHPGTVDTVLSRPFQRAVPDGRLFTPAVSAAHLLDVIDRAGPADNGSVLAWDGSLVPP
jgi:NAD(P)-dependent dehydrogenase (short-subunit alcohol dehydrogenase family)